MLTRRSRSPATEEMGKIRPLVEDDIPDIVALRRQAFRFTERPSPSDLGAYMTDMFLRGPWRDEALPSLVYEDGTGRAAGFLGVFPRRMSLEGEPIRVAVLTQLMVAESSRGVGVGQQLLRESLRGPQDLSLSDVANDAYRRAWERAGGRTALLYSLHWTRVLRPWRFLAAGLGGGLQRIMRVLARPLLAAGDAAAARLAHSRFRQTSPAAPGTELTVRAMVEHWPTIMRDYSLVGQNEEAILEYVLREAARKRDSGMLHRVLVRDAYGTVIGWYIYYLRVGDVGQVVHLAAAPGARAEVLDHLFYDAWKRGLIALRGRLAPRDLPVLSAKGCVLGRADAWTVVHSARRDVLDAIEKGDAMLSRLDGESWMTF
jgi:predicted N-acetyltransferase YhbS